jgi:predicted Fe-Mo cluster-binding NifX family protein
MKIAFTAYGNSWREQVDIRFGRAKGFFIVDTETEETSYINNVDNLEASHGAGTSAAAAIVEAGVKELITGRVGPNAAAVLKKENIKVLGGIGYTSIKEAYNLYKQNKLVEQTL